MLTDDCNAEALVSTDLAEDFGLAILGAGFRMMSARDGSRGVDASQFRIKVTLGDEVGGWCE